MYYGDLIAGLETVLEPEVLDEVKKKLLENANRLDRGDFRRLHIAESVFGGSERGGELGFHHGRAHQVIADTITGVVEDIRDFREGVVRAEVLLTDADQGARSDLAHKEAAVAALASANSFFAGDARNQESRNEHLGGGEGR